MYRAIGLILLLACSAQCSTQACDLTSTQECLGDAVDLVPGFYLNPVANDLRSLVKERYCGKGTEACLGSIQGNCSDVTLAPYRTIVSTVNFICQTALNGQTSCVSGDPLQRAVGFCFKLFKVVIYDVMQDPNLNTSDVNKGLCSAYDDVIRCSRDAANNLCDTRSQSYIQTLLYTTSNANRHALGCQ